MRPLHVTATANASLQNKINISIVFHHVRESGPIYRAKIARDLNLSAPAVSRAVEALKREGYIIETAKAKTGNGKLAAHVMVNSSFGWVIAIDLLKEPTKIAVSNLECDMIEQREGFKLDDAVDVEAELIREIEEVLDRRRSRGDLKAISVGVPAVIDESGRVASAFLYSSLEGRSIKSVLERRFGVPTFVENGANLSALAEAKHGQGRECRNFVFVEISSGIGAGIVAEGSLVRGVHGSAGEIGFSLTRGMPAKSGDFLERTASVESLRRAAIEGIERGEAAPRLIELAAGLPAAITPATVCIAALRGDPLATRILAATTESLAIAIVNLALVLDPERIILGGDICQLPEVERLFVDPIRQKVRGAIPFAAPQLFLSGLQDSAGVIGSAQLAVDSLLTGMYPYRMAGEKT